MSEALKQAVAALEGGDPAQAVAICDAALAQDRRDGQMLHFRGIALHYAGQSEDALASIRSALEITPTNANAHMDLGNLLKETGREEEALESYGIALQLDPQNARCFNNVATILRNAGQLDDAVEALRTAIRLEPELAEAHHNLGNCLSDLGDQHAALEAYQNSFRLGGDWSDPVRPATALIALGRHDEAESLLNGYLSRHPEHEAARHHLSGLRGETISRASDAYVQEHFDQFAASFDSVLKRLDYQAPLLVQEAVAAQLGTPNADRDTIDLGCGTGLCGPLIMPYKREMTGIDLSSQMLRRAHTRGCYDALYVAELQEFLEAIDESSTDLIVCADTINYLGDLTRSFTGVARTLRPGGLFVVTTEKSAAGEQGYTLTPSGRFHHTLGYLEAQAKGAGLKIVDTRDVVLRKEAHERVHGFVLSMVL